MSGVEIHAQAMNTILSGQFIKPAASSMTCLTIMLFAVVIGLITLRTRVLWSVLSTLFVAICYCLVAFYLFDHGLILNLLYPFLSLVMVSLGMNIFNVTLARMEKEEINRTFGRYVSPPVAAKILNNINQGSLELGGEECAVTVLFADVRNFTGYCEKLGPGMVVQSLNRYFSVIIDSILQHDGIISKFGGDNIMAVWNAPIKCPEHALYAVKAAAAAREKIKNLHTEMPDIVEMQFGIGINTGKAIVGNMGSLDRLEYSLIGDTVNIAARLSALAPGNKIWVGPETYELVKHQFAMAPVGPLALKGKEQLVDVYELSSLGDLLSGETSSMHKEPVNISV
jgi:adenylate cyclase